MKTKLFIAFALVLAAVAVVWSWRHRSPSIARLPAPVQANRVAAGTPVHSIKIVPMNRARMVMVTRPLNAKRSSLINPWTDIQLIIDEMANDQTRLNAVDRLPSRLSDADWGVLKGFLLKPGSLDSQQLEQVLKNVLMDKLCQMNPSPNGLGTVLAQMYQNQEQDEVLRDYALQHLATLDVDLAQSSGQGIAREEKTDQKVLWSGINEAGDSIAGTALLGLVRLSEQPNAGVDENKIAATALELANDAAAGELTQITAYQVCAQLNIQNALPTIEAAAQNSQNVAVQISAIGALGLIGGSADIALLQNLLQGNNERLQLPAQTAIERIRARAQATSQSG